MPSTLVGLLVALVALLPGGVHTWSFERETGKAEHQASDRLPRLLAASALYLVVSAPALPTLRAVATSAATGTTTAAWRYVLTVGLLIVLPWAIGTVAGRLVNRRHEEGVRGWLGRRVAGPGYASRAWDHLFAVKGLTGTIRVVLNDDTTIIGTWAERSSRRAKGDPPSGSYASGFPHQQTDLYISQLIRIDHPDQTGQETDAAAWVPGASIRYLEFYPNTAEGES